MKQAVQRRVAGIAAGISVLAMGSALPVVAQFAPGQAQPFPDQQTEQGDPFSNRGTGAVGSVLDMINRSVLGPSRSVEEFAADQQDSLDAATAEFRAKQMERLGQPQSVPAVSEPQPQLQLP